MHWLVASSSELYADYVTTYSALHGATVWITSDNKKYQDELTNLLDRIGIEEKIYDWAYTTGVYGDLFVRPEARPGLGVISVNDDAHPMSISRIDKGVLIGFYETPLTAGTSEIELQPPWRYIHFRILGSRKRRHVSWDPMFSQYSSVHFLSNDPRQMSSKYGTSLIINALSPYKRLRLAEDALLLARATRGTIKYLYKVKVDAGNVDAVSSIISEYVGILKQARAVDTRPTSPYYDERMQLLTALEDIILPVFGDVNDITVEQIGGDADIKWIVDIEELRNQLASALRTPLSLLGGFTDEASGALGSQAIEQLDIRFARASRRLQRALIEGVTRLCQVHLAHLNMDPDVRLFKVNMPETSTAEDMQIKETLDTSLDVIDKFMTTLDSVEGATFDKPALLDFLSKKILRIGDLDITNFIKEDDVELTVEKRQTIEEAVDTFIGSRDMHKNLKRHPITNTDFKAWTIMDEAKWTAKYGACKIKVVKTMPEIKK